MFTLDWNGCSQCAGARTQDKRACIIRAIQDFPGVSLRTIADHIGVSKTYVSQIKDELEKDTGSEAKVQVSTSGQVTDPAPKQVKGKDGKTYRIKPKVAKRARLDKSEVQPDDKPEPAKPVGPGTSAKDEMSPGMRRSPDPAEDFGKPTARQLRWVSALRGVFHNVPRSQWPRLLYTIRTVCDDMATKLSVKE